MIQYFIYWYNMGIVHSTFPRGYLVPRILGMGMKRPQSSRNVIGIIGNAPNQILGFYLEKNFNINF